MKLTWNSLRISITGAKLSHLVQKDKIWDHGSMVEQVKNIFYIVEKAKHKAETEAAKKYLTANGLKKLKLEIEAAEKGTSFLKKSVLAEVSIVQVSPAKKEKPDCFKALIKGKRKIVSDLIQFEVDNYGIENFSEEWCFVRQGDWWLLDRMNPTR